jgi:hypothetical protein
MSERIIGRRLFTDGITRPIFEDERGQFIEEGGEWVDGVWLLPEEDQADTPVIVQNRVREMSSGNHPSPGDSTGIRGGAVRHKSDSSSGVSP